jgi:antirestriction protein ArdC
MPGAYEKVMQSRKALVEKIIRNMEQGFIFPEKMWDRAAMSPQNPISGARYRGGNKLRLMSDVMEHGYQDPRWMTFRQLAENGYRLRPEAKGTGVLCEKWIFDKKVEQKDESGDPKLVNEKLAHPVVSYFYVFNGDLVEGLPELQKKELTQDETLKIADDLISTSECPIHEVAQDRSFYRPLEDAIYVPMRSSFRDGLAFCGVVLHEMGHSTGHPDRLNRPIVNMFGTPKYAMEELRAELGAYFTETDLKIDLGDMRMADHTAYLQSWIGALKDDPNELFRACADAEAIAERIVGNYERKYKRTEEIAELEPKTEVSLPEAGYGRKEKCR